MIKVCREREREVGRERERERERERWRGGGGGEREGRWEGIYNICHLFSRNNWLGTKFDGLAVHSRINTFGT